MTFRSKLRALVASPSEGNTPIEFECFRRDRLRTPPSEFQREIERFKELERQSDPGSEYRNAFYFQFPCEFDGVSSIKEYFKEGPIRSIDLMDIIGPHIDFDGKSVLSLGCHNGAELYWLYDRTDAAEVHGVDANRHFEDFICLLSTSYGLEDRIRFTRADALEFLQQNDQQYDVIVCHGLLYMMWDPLMFLRMLRSNLAPGGTCSLEVYTLKGERPVMEFLGDGSGWGDTFGFTTSFLENILPAYGFSIERRIQYRDRAIFLLRSDGGGVA